MTVSRFSRHLLTLLALAACNSSVDAAIIRLDNTPGGLGVLLDEINIGNLGTPAAGPIGVPGISGLDITVVAIGDNENTTNSEDVNSTADSLGVNATGGSDDTDAFDAEFSEFATFRFNRDVAVSALDFTTFTAGEEFEFAGFSIAHDDLTDGVGKAIVLSTPLLIKANNDFTLRATSGTIGLEAFDIAAVPEPSSCGLLCLGAIALISRRRRQRRRQRANPSDV